jgi:chromosome segregation ATPase
VTPEELVKQLRYPTDPCLPGNRGLMRDAADMIEQGDALNLQVVDDNERLRAELAVAQDDILYGREEEDRLRAELAAEKATADLIEAANRTFAEQNDRLRAELADYDDESTELCGDLAQARHEANVAEAAIARVRELCDETDGPPTVRKDVIRAAIEGNQP